MSPVLVLFLIFLVLKLTGLIAWSWLWVTAPIWIPVAFAAVCALLGITIVGRTHRRSRRHIHDTPWRPSR